MKFKEYLNEKLKTGMEMYANQMASYLVANETAVLKWLNKHYSDTKEVTNTVFKKMSSDKKGIVSAIINDKKY